MIDLNRKPIMIPDITLNEYLDAAIPGLLNEERNGIDWYARPNFDRVAGAAATLYGVDSYTVYKILVDRYHTAKETRPDGTTTTSRLRLTCAWEARLMEAFALIYGLTDVLPANRALYFELKTPLAGRERGRILLKLNNRWRKWIAEKIHAEGVFSSYVYDDPSPPLDVEYLNELLAELKARANTETL